MNEKIFKKAFQMAQTAYRHDEVPVGAVVFCSKTGEIIASAYNKTEKQKNPLAHAEIIAIQKACKKLNVKRLDGYSLFVTLEPCAMCAGAISWARLDHLYFGAFDEKTGAIEQGARVFCHSQTHHKPTVEGGINQQECSVLLTNFFKQKRQLKKGL